MTNHITPIVGATCFGFRFLDFFNEKLYRSLKKSYYFSIETHFVLNEYAYLIPKK